MLPPLLFPQDQSEHKYFPERRIERIVSPRLCSPRKQWLWFVLCHSITSCLPWAAPVQCSENQSCGKCSGNQFDCHNSDLRVIVWGASQHHSSGSNHWGHDRNANRQIDYDCDEDDRQVNERHLSLSCSHANPFSLLNNADPNPFKPLGCANCSAVGTPPPAGDSYFQ